MFGGFEKNTSHFLWRKAWVALKKLCDDRTNYWGCERSAIYVHVVGREKFSGLDSLLNFLLQVIQIEN